MDELRNEIWDYVFEADGPKSLDEIARYAGCDRETLDTAVDHEWFDVEHDQVTIAYAASSK